MSNPSGRMTAEEFHAWMETEPDDYEFLRGVAVRRPESKQGARRLGVVFNAAMLALGDTAHDWFHKPLPHLESSLFQRFGGKLPFEVAAESWASLAALLDTFPDLADGRRLFGDRFGDLKPRKLWVYGGAARLAEVERQRAADRGEL